MSDWVVDVEFGVVTSCGEVLRGELGVDRHDVGLTFEQLFARAPQGDRRRLMASLHKAVLVTGTLDEVIEIDLDGDARPVRVRGSVAHRHPGVVEGTCEVVAHAAS